MHATFDGDGNKGLAGWSRFGERQIRAKKRVDGMQARPSGSSLRDPSRELARFAGFCMGLAYLAGYPASGSQRHQGLYGVGGALS